ncbi:glycoside hydrolase family 3 [Flammeovirga sp. MY04]|uniref:glycoside hydrolase family 3 protein n=1 Tax=Flammeovirga sp. MY04 TaxID=1191459 RepID=UPI00080610F4|nr:glycoside hydrolase family 3 N-terminal domain-containing protein [Flammeovirga sp. MY04]ANQ48757.1 glycoside hydrolase family 3 [Flammeovirga sp. MY04]
MSNLKALIFLLFFCFVRVHAQTNYPKFYQVSWEDIVWVDSVWKSLNEDEKIAQLFVVPHYTKGSLKEVKMLVRKYNVGGVIFFKGNVEDQIQAINELNRLSKTPLVHTLDAEWGLGMRLPKSGISYPYAMTLGAIENDSLIYQMTSQIAEQLKQVGVGISYGPVVDINNNPLNPVISYRSFGEDRERVTNKAEMYFKGLEDHKVLSVIKHFPGHGDTNVDSHKDLPIIPFDKNRLDSLELFPYKKLIQMGVGGVMTAHLSVPHLDKNYPSSLSKNIVNNLLKEELNFKGLIFTDGILMDAITKRYDGYGKGDALALEAGNDVVEFTNHVGSAIKEVKKRINAGTLTWDQIDQKGWKFLLLKRWAMLDHQKGNMNTQPRFDIQKAKTLKQELCDEAVTLLFDNSEKRTFSKGDKVAIVNIGKNSDTHLKDKLGNQGCTVKSFYLSKHASETDLKNVVQQLKQYDQIITQFGSFYMSPRMKTIAVQIGQGNNVDPNQKYPYGITYSMLRYMELTEKLAQHHAVFYGNAYVLRSFPNIEHLSSCTVAYQDLPELRNAYAKAITGEMSFKGVLPVSIDTRFKVGTGIKK